MNQERGFTLIELVVVIVILGILAATALPKFIDLTSDAEQAAITGVAGALSSAAAVNYASHKANTAKGTAIANCTDVSKAMQNMPANYTIGSAAVTADNSTTCTLTKSSYTATFIAIGT